MAVLSQFAFTIIPFYETLANRRSPQRILKVLELECKNKTAF
jgi:hypothetical protein